MNEIDFAIQLIGTAFVVFAFSVPVTITVLVSRFEFKKFRGDYDLPI